MRNLSDALLPLVEARLLAMGARVDLIEIADEELGITFALHCPTRAAYEAFIPHSVGPLRASARFGLIAACLAYPCDAKGEPDIEGLTAAIDEQPALVEDLHRAIDELATGEGYDVIKVSPETMGRCRVALGERLDALIALDKRARVVVLPEGSPVRAFGLRTPPRVTWDDYNDGSGLDKLCEKAEAMAHDCIVGIDDKKRLELLRWAPALAIALVSTLSIMAGSRRRDPRKKARRGSSASSAPIPSTPESV